MNPEVPNTPPSPNPQPASPGAPPLAQYRPGIGVLPAANGIASNGQSAPGYQPPIQSAAGPVPAYATNYLDQIAAKPQAKGPNKLAIIALVGGVLVAAVLALLLINGLGSPDFTGQAKTINARIDTLQTVATAQQKHLTENVITEANATLSSSLTTMNTDLASLSTSKEKNADQSTAALETVYQTTLAATLDAAYQRGTLDRTYTVQMTYELTILRTMLVELKTNASRDDTKQFCDTSIANLDSILKLYANFYATKS